MSSNDPTGPTPLHHYPRRFRWRADPPDCKGHERASLTVNGRHVGGIIRYRARSPWYAYGADFCDIEGGARQRRCDAKRAVECAALAGMRRALGC